MKVHQSNDYLPTLDGWRAIAILMVLVCHGFAMIQGPSGYFPNEFWRAITVKGSLGVQLFFGISGFLICSRLLDEETGGGRIGLKGFYVRRIFRILPPYAVNLIAIWLLAASSLIAMTPREWWASVFFVRNYVPIGLNEGWYTGHFWSLMVEEHFYLLAPGLLVLVPKTRRLGFFLGICAAISLWRTFDFRTQWSSMFLGPGQTFTGRSDVTIDTLFWGAAGALAVREYREFFVRLAHRAWLTPALISAVILTETVRVPQGGFVQGFLIVSILLSTLLHPQTLVSRALEAGWLRWIGRLSYSLYIWNNLFLIPDHIRPVAPLSYLQYPPVNIICVFAVATLSYYFVEKPMISLGRKLASRWRSKPLTSESVPNMRAS
ncbi:MAG: acyltransferase [Bdellovibrionia bacterium]